MNKRPDEQYTDAELITIIEGPPPEFRQPMETWAISVQESQRLYSVVYCQMRTLNGPGMLERCQAAWSHNRPLKLDFPDEMGLRQQADIVAARWSETAEGQLLHLWLRTSGELAIGNEPDLPAV